MAKVNLAKASGVSSPGAAAPKNEIIIFESDGIFFPNSDAGGVLIQGNFVLPAGDKMVTVYSTKSKTEATMETEGDEDSMSFKSMVKLQHPGNSKEVKEFVQYWTGKNVIVMHKACGEDFYEVCGTPCAPLQLKAAKKDDNDARFWTLSFEPFAKSGFVPKIYQGAVVFAEPIEVADATAVTLDVNNRYSKLPVCNNGEEIFISTILNEDPFRDHGKIFTLIGSGGDDPAVLNYGQMGAPILAQKFLLKMSAQWVALKGATISFQLFHGNSENYYIEVSRS